MLLGGRIARDELPPLPEQLSGWLLAACCHLGAARGGLSTSCFVLLG